jgi:hypothetical protein
MSESIRSYLRRLCYAAAEAQASQIEVDALTGCAGCGRRVVGGEGEPIAGAVLARLEGTAKTPRAVCGECLKRPKVMRAVLDSTTA